MTATLLAAAEPDPPRRGPFTAATSTTTTGALSFVAFYDRRLPCGTPSARINHAAHSQDCPTCFPDQP